MLFHTVEFAYFFVLFFLFYWFLFNKNVSAQNLLVFVASYVFYGWWDWRFLSLIAFSTVVDFVLSRKLGQTESIQLRKILLFTSIAVNIGLLGFFKYYDFFVDNLYTLLNSLGLSPNLTSLKIILPVGISFYTFQTLSYTLDVYRKKIQPTNDFIAFGAFVSFFPQLVAGPIERASNLLPQFHQERKFRYKEAVEGGKQILWGLFKKVVIADKCGELADMIFANASDLNGSALILGAVFFSFQIYGDFSGYSDMAIGLARLLGFNLMQNFAFPYFSRDIAEFWRRWHISLSTWFRDYLYIPLGGSRGNLWMQVRNILIIFLVSGFWHGANWTFLFWGFLNALFFLPLLLSGKNRQNMNTVSAKTGLPHVKEMFGIVLTFIMVAFAWIFFRADSMSHALVYVKGIFVNTLAIEPSFSTVTWGNILITISLIIFFIVIEWYGRYGSYGLQKILVNYNRISRWPFYAFLLFLVLIYYKVDRTAFIYFQF